MGSNIKISIITVTFNSEKTLQRTIDSYKSQKYPNKELIIIDGNSKDKTVDIIRNNESVIDYWISENDKGISDAINKGLKKATGDWFYFLNSDDIFYNPEVLREIFKHTYEDISLLYGDVILKSTGEKYDGQFTIEKLFHKNICHQAQLFHKSTLNSVGLYNINYRYLSDYDYTLRIFSDRKLKTLYTPITIAEFDDSGRTSFMHDKHFWKDRKEIFINRFKSQYKVSTIAEAYMPYFTHITKQGSLPKAFAIMLEMFILTKQKKWIFDGLKNLKDRTIPTKNK